MSPPGNPYRLTRCPNGTGTPSLEFLSTGGFTVFLPLGMSGIPGICTWRALRSTNIISRLTADRAILAIRILSLCSRPKSSAPRSGRNYSNRRGPGMWCRWRSTMTDFRCTEARCPTGTPMRWGRKETCLGS